MMMELTIYTMVVLKTRIRSPRHRIGSISYAKSPVGLYYCGLFNCLRCLMPCIFIALRYLWSAFFCFVLRFLDESPRWLFSQGRYQESSAIIRKMLIQNGKADDPEQGFTLDQLQRALSTTTVDIDKESLEKPSSQLTVSPVQEDGKEVSSIDRIYGIVDLFKTPRLRSRTLNISLNW